MNDHLLAELNRRQPDRSTVEPCREVLNLIRNPYPCEPWEEAALEQAAVILRQLPDGAPVRILDALNQLTVMVQLHHGSEEARQKSSADQRRFHQLHDRLSRDEAKAFEEVHHILAKSGP